MKSITTLFSLALLMHFLNPLAQAEKPNTTLARRQLELGVELLTRATPETNRVVSPLSIHACLTLAALGARGDTATQLNRLLFGEGANQSTLESYRDLLDKIFQERPETVNRIANSVWIDSSITLRSEYQKQSESILKAAPHHISFAESEAARNKINGWVSVITEKLIPELIPKGLLSPQTTMALVNALYFKGSWKTPFSKSSTAEQPFSLTPERSRAVPMMTTTLTTTYAENEQWKVALLPYKSDDFALLLVVPKRTLDMQNLVKTFNPQLVDQLFSETIQYSVTVHLPRFTSRYSADIAQQLAAVSGPLPFSAQADFTGITNTPLLISTVQHEAVVIVDEEGTEAAAATAVIMLRSAMPGTPPQPREIRADKPFMFVLLHVPSRTPLFVGAVADPQ
jgi:serpin B